MKTTLKNMVATLIIALLPALTGAAQAGAVEYKNNYRDVHQPVYQVRAVSTAAPTATFQSTSAYSGQWNQDDRQSMLNEDGSMNTEVYMSSGPRRAPGTPGGDLDPNTQQPLGDGLLVLMLMALVYTGIRLRKRAING
jgi:hypothetical protein